MRSRWVWTRSRRSMNDERLAESQDEINTRSPPRRAILRVRARGRPIRSGPAPGPSLRGADPPTRAARSSSLTSELEVDERAALGWTDHHRDEDHRGGGDADQDRAQLPL